MMSPALAETKWDGKTSASFPNQNALTWVRTRPFSGIGSSMTTSKALIRSLATSRRWSGPAS